MKVADLLEERLDEFAIAESQDQGKPVWLAKKVDIPRAILNFRHFAHTAPHVLGTYVFFSACISHQGKIYLRLLNANFFYEFIFSN